MAMVKTSCLIIGLLVLVAIMAICLMVKLATDINVDEKRLDDLPTPKNVLRLSGTGQGVRVISLDDKSTSFATAERFPYVGAITRNSSNTWTFACFASVILIKWVVTSAHCRQAGSSHRLLLYSDIVRNYSQTYPILFWRVHESYNTSTLTPKYDIAVAKLKLDVHPFTIKSSTVNEQRETSVEASVWKTVATMNRKTYLTNDFDKFDVIKLAPAGNCYESFGMYVDESMICVDMSHYDDCFIYDFGPLFAKDKVVGISAANPRDCDMKLAIFTNVSFYTNWILKTTKTTWRADDDI